MVPMGVRGHTHTTGEHYIWSVVEKTGIQWKAVWFVGTRNGVAFFDSREDAEEYCKRSINREACGLI